MEGVVPGRRVVLHVNSGPWQGWYTCEVVSTDPMGCYVRHESDGFTENVPWAYLNGGKYTMELLPEGAKRREEHLSAGAPPSSAAPLSSSATPVPGDAVEAAAAPVRGGDSRCEDCLRSGRLRVHSDLGAGLTVVACELGYFISRIDEPGQPDLRRGDAIVAVGGALLLGLTEEEVEARFGEAFGEGCLVVAGSYLSLRRRPFAEVRQEAERLLLNGPDVPTTAERVADELVAIPAGAAAAGPPPLLPAAASVVRSISERLTPFAGGLLRRSRLQLDVLSGEAGLELSTCQAGYAVDKILARPGQPGLCLGDAIVAIGGQALLGLDEAEVEERFGEALCNGTEIVTASLAELTLLPFELVQHEVSRFLSESCSALMSKLERTATN